MLRVLVSIVERDLYALGLAHHPGSSVLDAFTGALEAAGLQVRERRPATREDIFRLDSSWAKRLDIPRRRPAWLLTAEKP